MAYVGLDTVVGIKVTAGATEVAPGRVENAEFTLDQSLTHLTGAGGQDSVVYSMMEPKGSLSMWVTKELMIDFALKTVINGLPPVIAQIDGGVLGSKVVMEENCYVDSLTLSLEKGGALKADMSWLALSYTTSAMTTAPTAEAKNLMLLWHSSCITLDGNAYEAQSISVKLENGLKMDTDLDCKTAGEQRLPTVILPGNMKVTLDVEFAAAPTVIFSADVPAIATVGLSVKNTESSVKTFTLTAGNLHPLTMPVPVAAGEDSISYKMSLEADYNDLTSLTWGLS